MSKNKQRRTGRRVEAQKAYEAGRKEGRRAWLGLPCICNYHIRYKWQLNKYRLGWKHGFNELNGE